MGDGERAPVSILAGFVEGALNSAGSHVKNGENASQSEIAGLPHVDQKFSLSGSDTDREVNRLLGGFKALGGNSESSVFGSADQSIFFRMSNFLVKCQIENKVSYHQNDSGRTRH